MSRDARVVSFVHFLVLYRRPMRVTKKKAEARPDKEGRECCFGCRLPIRMPRVMQPSASWKNED